jgi:hypothetical protein
MVIAERHNNLESLPPIFSYPVTDSTDASIPIAESPYNQTEMMQR